MANRPPPRGYPALRFAAGAYLGALRLGAPAMPPAPPRRAWRRGTLTCLSKPV